MSSNTEKNAIATDIGKDGIAAPNPISVEFTGHVAPVTVGDERYNTIKEHLQVIGCCSLPDERFDFDKSVVVSGAKDEFVKLHKLREDLKKDQNYPPLSIFGHTDRVSDDHYNTRLSWRRAGAVYAVLIRDVEIWELLMDKPQGNDDWGVDGLNMMLVFTGQTPVEKKSDLTKDQRRQLIKAYMDAICVDKDGNPYTLDKDQHFLSKGNGEDSSDKWKDSKGKVQGCGELNLQIILSAQNDQKLPKEERNELNRRNRRVIAFLFKPGSEIDRKIWPCPNIDLTVNTYDWAVQQARTQCGTRLWSNYKDRLKQDAKNDRLFTDYFDTFACRHYQGISRNSPCEFATKLWVIQLLSSTPYLQKTEDTTPGDPDAGRMYLQNRRFVCKAGDAAAAPIIHGRTDDRGFLRIPVFDEKTDIDLKVDIYGLANDPELDKDENKLEEAEKKFTPIKIKAGYIRHLKTGAMPDGSDASPENQRIAAKQRLYNLAYGPGDYEAWTEDDLDNAIKKFQTDNDLPQKNGVLDDNTLTAMKILHEPYRMI